MTTPTRVDLLHALCALLPERDAHLIRTMPHDDTLTYVEAYASARRSGVELPGDLRRDFVSCLLEHLEADLGQGREPASS